MEAAALASVVSMTLKVVGNKLAPLLIKEYTSIAGVKRDLEELRDQVEEINSWLETRYEAMWNGPSFNWLKRLKDVAYAVDDVVDEYQLKAEKHDTAGGGGIMSKDMFIKPKAFILQCKVASKIKTLKNRFAAIVKQRADFITITNSSPFAHPVDNTNKTTLEMQSLPIVDATSVLGRDQDKDMIITELVKSNAHQEIQIVSIIGLGGSGKSTLAKLVFSDSEDIKKHFELSLWVHVSQEINIIKVVEKLFEAITEEKSDKYPLQHISAEISRGLNGKKFLLVLDDVWTEDRIQWEQFMVHLKDGAPESKILLTTRSRRVAEAMESIYIFDLPFLSLDDSWQLFHRSFGAAVKGLSSEFQKVGKEIVKKCGGMPLAIKSLAGVLRGMERIEEWQAMRDSNLLDVQGEEQRVAACLRLTYFHLPSYLKQCFTLCSVIPKGHKIYKEQLVDLWITHDIISVVDGADCLDYIGHKHFNSLVQISFLQNVEEEGGRVTCRMHDLVHDLAQLILGDEISLVVPKEGEKSTSYRYFSLREQPEDLVPKNLFGKARAVYITKCHDYIFGMALKDAKHLRSVTVVSPYVTALPNTVFQIINLKYLAMSRLNCEALPDAISNVWSLQALHITDSLYLLGLPKSIGKLKKLRTLNLSGCRYLNRLPDSIGDCHMISNINLWHCRHLTMLPNTIGRNKELRVLRLGCTRLRRLPSIATLEILQCLDLRRCYELVELPEGIESLKKLEVLNLEGCVMLISLLVLKGQQLDQVQDLNISVVGWGEKSALISELENIIARGDAYGSVLNTYVMEPDDAQKICLKQKNNLQGLNLRWMPHDTAEVDNESVQDVLDDLEPPHGIKTLDIHGYSGRHYARWMQNQVGGGVHDPSPFPFLRVMKLYDFHNLKHLDGLVELPCLEELELQRMPSLESISGGPFPSLVTLKMEELPRLREVWMVAERTMLDKEDRGDYHNFTSHLGQVSGKPYLPSSLQHLWLSGISEKLLQSSGQCQGPSLSLTFSHMTACKSLQICYSDMLTELSESIGEIRCLQNLTIMSCPRLSTLPQSIGYLTSLQELLIKSCAALERLPKCLGELCYLRILKIEDLPGLTCLPQSMSSLTCLVSLCIKHCPGLASLPEEMKDLTSLEELLINNCPGLTSLPQGMKGLTSLKKLMVDCCPGIKSLPEGIKDLKALKELQIWGCTDLATCCKRGMGENWHLISRIPYVLII